MAMHPEIQKRAREELDTVVGSDRLPTFEDYESLPYIRAIIMECSRWLPVVPMSVPHRVTRDDYYKGYFIPEGTVVLAVSRMGFVAIAIMILTHCIPSRIPGMCNHEK
jgi:cytochrome P450